MGYRLLGESLRRQRGHWGSHVPSMARCRLDGGFRSGQGVGRLKQKTRVTITTSKGTPASFTTNQIVLQMYVGGSYVFLQEIFPFEKTWGPKVAAVNLTMARAVSLLAAPEQVSPADHSGFSHYPRATTLVWNPVNGAASYTVEVDCMHCCESNQWCSEVGESWKVVTNLTETTYRFDFVGAQAGRWRVWAVGSNGVAGPKSGWWVFSYSK